MTAPSPFLIRPLMPGDEAAWRPLWAGYLEFYRQALKAEVTEATWRRLTDPAAADMFGRAAVANDRLVGILHAVLHANTWSVAPVCYLEDLLWRPMRAGAGWGRR